MKRVIVFVYGLISYFVFFGSFLYAIGFTGNIFVPKSIDSGTAGPVGTAILINALLLGAFAIQHTIMARSGFKKFITKMIPEAAERSTFVLLSSLLLFLLYWQWQPIEGYVWQIENSGGIMAMNILFWLGWAIVLTATFVINHFELFGLSQVTRYLLKREFTPPPFTNRGYYKFVRHPIMFGFLVAFWATPEMSYGHMLFTVATTGYIFMGVMFEERDLRKNLGPTYVEYSKEVPMLIPFTKIKPSSTPPNESTGQEVLGEN